ncbi:MAG: adenosylmethionine--8-amino-7-oxononanoate transaminase [Acidiferrobacterales bacterium]|nr:adenosylmethionine--8-amino-7-oxononanoate transaminase [Acidiferrobacterales bacterium]
MTESASPIWHPFTQHALFPDFVEIERAEGAYLYTADGRQIIDAISSWWVITHGHCHPTMQDAARRQIERLDQVIFAGYTHEPAEETGRLLEELTPDGLDYVFFSDSGSTAVEVALKMALGYWHHLGSDRQRVLVLEHSYHGDTIGTMSVGERGVFNQPYDPLLFSVERIPFPAEGEEQKTIDALERSCRNKPDVAALIAEPLVLGAGGMLMYGTQTLAEMKRVCERYDVLFIADEVMTAWGRTGSLFACDQAGVVPDIACYSKGITGGFLPLAVTMCHERVFQAHYSTDRRRTFYHSSSYTANPIACAVAAANLKMWKQPDVLDRVSRVAEMQKLKLSQLEGSPWLTSLRRRGTIAAMDVRVPDRGYLSEIGTELYLRFQKSGVLLRPLGNTIYVLPPYCVTLDDLDRIYEIISDTVSGLLE